jgi:FKBP-type peptidyl-prolyl cis-trans isomerase 2
MGRRFARMKLLAGNDIKFKVEIVPIDNQQDHYYLMT